MNRKTSHLNANTSPYSWVGTVDDFFHGTVLQPSQECGLFCGHHAGGSLTAKHTGKVNREETGSNPERPPTHGQCAVKARRSLSGNFGAVAELAYAADYKSVVGGYGRAHAGSNPERSIARQARVRPSLAGISSSRHSAEITGRGYSNSMVEPAAICSGDAGSTPAYSLMVWQEDFSMIRKGSNKAQETRVDKKEYRPTRITSARPVAPRILHTASAGYLATRNFSKHGVIRDDFLELTL